MASLHKPLSAHDIDTLQQLLDAVPAPLEPLDVSMVDGFLCGVLVQPEIVPVERWIAHVTDADGRALPARFDAAPLHALVRRRHAELGDLISRRQWFDPWVFELTDDEAEPADFSDDDDRDDDQESDGSTTGTDAVYPWVAGFATAMELFPGLMRRDATALTEPLALLYQHLAPDDLEDADELLTEIDSMEPPADLSEAVEGLVRATLLLADVGRPQAARATRPAAVRNSRPVRPGPPSRR